jgi:small subunit ribosomal protein S15
MTKSAEGKDTAVTAAQKEGSKAVVAEKSATKGVIGTVSQEDVATGTQKLSQKEKGAVIQKFQINSKDVGSPEVQIALLTRRLETLTQHFSSHPKDFHSQRGMLDLISRRKRLLSYLRHEDTARYRSTISALGIRK